MENGIDKIHEITDNKSMEIREGERHYGEYKRLVASDDRQLLRSIKSYERNAEEHRQKVLNPHK